MRIKRNIISICITLVVIAAIVIPVFAQSVTNPNPDGGTIKAQIDKLLADYQKALDNEISNGETKIANDSLGGTTKLLSGQSAVKMDALWKDTLNKINQLKARPATEREKAVQSIKSLENVSVSYIDQVRSPYDSRIQLERYQTGKYLYTIDINTNQISEIFLVDDKAFSTASTFSEKQLEGKAREFINKATSKINLDQLSLQVSNKEGLVYFFRWEDKSNKLDSGISPFIQVSLSSGGDMVNYINTLFPTLSAPSTASANLVSPLTTFNEVYSNGGNYWAGVLGFPVSTQNNAGFCYIYNSCSPKSFFYTTVTTGNQTALGRWSPNPSNANVVAQAFIPNTNATTQQACYIEYYNGLSSMSSLCIQQLPLNNAWVYITYQSLYNIRRIDLGNGNDRSNTAKIAWDEVWVHN